MPYRVGSFNIRKLSFATKSDELEDDVSTTRAYRDIGSILYDNYDIVALQEIMNENAMKQILQGCFGWEYAWIQSRSKAADSAEGYAFAWNTRKFQPVAEPSLWVQYREDPVLGAAGLLRHPFYGRFRSVAGPEFELRLITAHIRFKPASNKELPASDVELRQREFRVLSEQILNRLEDRAYGNGLVRYTILLGDYNLNLKDASGINRSPYVESLIAIDNGGGRKEIITVQDRPTTIRTQTVVDESTGRKSTLFGGFSNNYDHFTYTRSGFEDRLPNITVEALDSVTLYRSGDFERHWREISDHIPIRLTFDLK